MSLGEFNISNVPSPGNVAKVFARQLTKPNGVLSWRMGEGLFSMSSGELTLVGEAARAARGDALCWLPWGVPFTTRLPLDSERCAPRLYDLRHRRHWWSAAQTLVSRWRSYNELNIWRRQWLHAAWWRALLRDVTVLRAYWMPINLYKSAMQSSKLFCTWPVAKTKTFPKLNLPPWRWEIQSQSHERRPSCAYSDCWVTGGCCAGSARKPSVARVQGWGGCLTRLTGSPSAWGEWWGDRWPGGCRALHCRDPPSPHHHPTPRVRAQSRRSQPAELARQLPLAPPPSHEMTIGSTKIKPTSTSKKENAQYLFNRHSRLK